MSGPTLRTFLAALNEASAALREDPAKRYEGFVHMACGFGSALRYLECLTKIFGPSPRRVQHEACIFVIFGKKFDFSENVN
jgi:hypothetical protein